MAVNHPATESGPGVHFSNQPFQTKLATLLVAMHFTIVNQLCG